MQRFKIYCAQGDIYIRKIAEIPPEAIRVETTSPRVIVAHSETGHHHVMDADAVTMYRLPDSILKCLLVVDQPAALEHLRQFDTHEPILFDPGVYEVRRQREYVPEGFRPVED
jgi:hypothetical protein